MVVKNGMEHIRDAIRSFENQSHKNKQLIIVHSASNDGTNQFVNKIKKKNYKVIFDRVSKNKFGSLNIGINNANGDYIGILHSDDIFYSKDTLKNVANYLNKKKFDLIYGNCIFTEKKNSKIVRKWVSEKFNVKKMKYGWMPPHTSIFISKKLKKIKYPTQYNISGDYFYILNIFKNTNSIGFLNKFICKMKYGGDSTDLSNFFLKFKQDYDIAKKNFEFPFLVIIFKVLRKINQLF